MDKLTICKNKGEVFKCQFKVDGASIKDTVVRLCLEFDNNNNLFFYGSLQEDGNCEIEIPRLKNLEEKNGKMVIEAIADSIYFKLYEAEVEIKNSVEISMTPKATNSKPKMKVQLEGISQQKVSKKVEKPQEQEEGWEPMPKKQWEPLQKEEAPKKRLHTFQDYVDKS